MCGICNLFGFGRRRNGHCNGNGNGCYNGNCYNNGCYNGNCHNNGCYNGECYSNGGPVPYPTAFALNRNYSGGCNGNYRCNNGNYGCYNGCNRY